jgi:hypothetical protein
MCRGSAQSKNDHLKVEVDVDAELTKSFASWLVTCPTKNYGRRQGMYIYDQAHLSLNQLSCSSKPSRP